MKLNKLLATSLLVATTALSASLVTINTSAAHSTAYRTLGVFSHLDFNFSAPASSAKKFTYKGFKDEYRSKYSAVGASYNAIFSVTAFGLSLGAGLESGLNAVYGDLGKSISRTDPNYNKINGLEFYAGPAAMAIYNFTPSLATYLKTTATYGRLGSKNQTYSTSHYKVGLGVAYTLVHLEAGLIRHKFKGGHYLDIYKKEFGKDIHLQSYYLTLGLNF